LILPVSNLMTAKSVQLVQAARKLSQVDAPWVCSEKFFSDFPNSSDRLRPLSRPRVRTTIFVKLLASRAVCRVGAAT